MSTSNIAVQNYLHKAQVDRCMLYVWGIMMDTGKKKKKNQIKKLISLFFSELRGGSE